MQTKRAANFFPLFAYEKREIIFSFRLRFENREGKKTEKFQWKAKLSGGVEFDEKNTKENRSENSNIIIY